MATTYNPDRYNPHAPSINGPNTGASGYANSKSSNMQHQQPQSSCESGHVGFNDSKEQEYRQRILTVKYGSHQMKLIRKRLAIEDWLDKQLRILYNCKDDTDDYDTLIDLDEVLDLEMESERREFVREKVSNARQSPDVVNTFIQELLLKVDTL